MVIERLVVFRRVLTVAFLGLVLALTQFQLVRGRHYRQQSLRNSIRLVPLVGPRGAIFDRTGAPLAVDRLAFHVALVGQEVESVESACRRLAPLVGRSAEALAAEYRRNYTAPFAPTPVAQDVPKALALKVAESSFTIPGVTIQAVPQREYPLGAVAAHCLGFVGEIDRPLLSRWRRYGYQLKDQIGRAGLEQSLESYLRGEDGGQQILVDHRGRMVRSLGHRPARPGRPVQLTLHAALQQHLARRLDGQTGAAVVMDVENGAIWAMVSTPSFDPADPGAALTAPGAPLLNRVTQGLYPPGSIFKVATALAGLTSRRLSPSTTYVCRGEDFVGRQRFSCWRPEGHGAVSLRQGLVGSCNVYFIRAGLASGVEAVVRMARELGVGQTTGIELPQEQQGLLPSPSWKRRRLGQPWYEGDTANVSIGQGFLQMTPLQAVQMIAAVANGGRQVQPRLITRIGEWPSTRAIWRRLPVDTEMLRVVRDALRAVVADAHGTGKRAADAPVAIAGKTGTAQLAGTDETHAWFVGYCPADAPHLAFAILIERGGHGGDLPVMIANDMVAFLHGEGVI